MSRMPSLLGLTDDRTLLLLKGDMRSPAGGRHVSVVRVHPFQGRRYQVSESEGVLDGERRDGMTR